MVAGAAGRGSCSSTACAATGASSPAPTHGAPTRRGGKRAGATARRTSSRSDRAAGGAERFAVATTLPLNQGDLIRIHTGNGGGFGPPDEREQERVLADIRNGFVFP
jgi:N-methylhydantoinase B